MKITPTMVIDTKPATPDDLPVVLAILAETAVRPKMQGQNALYPVADRAFRQTK